MPDGFKHVHVSQNWQAGIIFSKITHNLFGDDVKWFRTNIRLSIRPNEEWPDAYIREYGESPEKSFHCFTPEGM